MFWLKIIAISTMLIDHSAVALSEHLPHDNYMMMRTIGRIAFPIFVFCIAEGCRRTSGISRFLFRLLIFAFVSEVAFDMLSAASWGFSVQQFFSNYFIDMLENWRIPWGFDNRFLRHQNVIFTLFLGVLAIHLYRNWHKDDNKLNNVVAGILAVVSMGLAANFINSDYGFIGVLIIFLSYFYENKHLRIIPFVLLAFLLYSNQIFLTIGALAALIPIYLYNGERGPAMKWAFYAFYPVHLFVLGMVGMLI